MKKTLAIAQGFALLVLIASPRSTPAKAATVKIIISGPDLSAPLEITDEHILNLSNVWAGQFLDASHGSLEKPPQRLPYELTFYVKLGGEDNLRLMYVAYYYPDPSSTKAGFIYLPGKREPWYYLNVGAILRENQDGRWSYASPAWEALIKPVIARAARRAS
jgi:hypothetical protein